MPNIKREPGQVIKINLNEKGVAYGHVLEEPIISFYKRIYLPEESVSLEEIVALPIAFTIAVSNSTITTGKWPIIGFAPLSPDEMEPVTFWKKDLISGAFSLYTEDHTQNRIIEKPATPKECAQYEQAAVWGAEHVEKRLIDTFEGREENTIIQHSQEILNS